MLKLYRFYWDCGRMGSVEGLFISTDDEVKLAIGKYVYLGEVLGKHSEVCGTLDAEDIDVISDDQEKITWLRSIFGDNVSGFNPLDYTNYGEEE